MNRVLAVGLGLGLLLLGGRALAQGAPEEPPEVPAAPVAEEPVGADAGPKEGDLSTERWTIPPEVMEAARAVRDRPLGERIAAISQPFLGLPYVWDAAGEGDEDDPDPVGRYDAFDCLTFVEETLAIALAGDPVDAAALRNAFRYRGAPSYLHRRHFMEAEWIPDAVQNGLVSDITAFVGHPRTVTKTVTAATWKGWGRRSLFRLPAEALPVGTWSLDYLDLAEAELAVPRIPPGAILLTLRSDRPGVPMVVTHVSLVIPGKDGAMMRHATRMGTRKVRDDRLMWYVKHIRDYVNWPALGVAVLMPREQGPRLAATTTEEREELGLGARFPPAEGALPHFEPQPLIPGR